METGWIGEHAKGVSFWNVVNLWLMAKITRLTGVGQVVGGSALTKVYRQVGEQRLKASLWGL